MKFQRLLHLTAVTILATGTVSTLSASATEYPPEILTNSHQYPPMMSNTNSGSFFGRPTGIAAPVSPKMPRMPVAPGIPQPRYSTNAYQRPLQRPYAINRGYSRNYSRPYAQYPVARGRYPAYPMTRSYGNRTPYRGYSRSNNNNGFPFSAGSMPFMGNGNNSFGNFSNPMSNMFGNNGFNNNSGSLPFFKQRKKKTKKAWGDKRNIWPDFYTDFTDESWDTMSSGPRDLGEMPGGWHFPLISTPDPVTVSDAVANQFPPFAEEAGNMVDFSKWGVFDDK